MYDGNVCDKDRVCKEEKRRDCIKRYHEEEENANTYKREGKNVQCRERKDMQERERKKRIRERKKKRTPRGLHKVMSCKRERNRRTREKKIR